MNVRKPTDYGAMFTSLDALMAVGLRQIELYWEIGKLISARPEKGAAVAAEYLASTYPGASGFSPRNLRRMREFYRAAGGAGSGYDHRLDAERCHFGNGADAPGAGMVHPPVWAKYP